MTTHGIAKENLLDDDKFELICYCGESFIGKRTVESNARNDAYRKYREHVRINAKC